MGIKRPLDFRFPELEHSYTQGGIHDVTANNVWQTVIDFSNKRGTMYLRHTVFYSHDEYVGLRVTIDGVAYPIQTNSKSLGKNTSWILDFNESVKIEHNHMGTNPFSRVEYAYYEYKP